MKTRLAVTAAAFAALLSFSAHASPLAGSCDATTDLVDRLLADLAPLSSERTMAEQVVKAVQDGDFATLSAFAHPTKGIRFSPYVYVRDEYRVFAPAEIARFGEDSNLYLWGYADGSGFAMEMTPKDYLAQKIGAHGFLKAQEVNVNNPVVRGNTLRNVESYFPGATVVEFHRHGSEGRRSDAPHDYTGMDWQSVNVVLEKVGGKWTVVGLVTDHWTI